MWNIDYAEANRIRGLSPSVMLNVTLTTEDGDEKLDCVEIDLDRGMDFHSVMACIEDDRVVVSCQARDRNAFGQAWSTQAAFIDFDLEAGEIVTLGPRFGP